MRTEWKRVEVASGHCKHASLRLATVVPKFVKQLNGNGTKPCLLLTAL